MLNYLHPRDLTIPSSVASVLVDHATLFTGVTVLLLLMPVAVYFALREPQEHR